MLAGPATPDGKRFICRQLGLIGTAAEVPALESLLADEQFAFAARSALERIPGEESLAAMRRAAEKAKGLIKAGLIQSLGVRRDKKAIALLADALKDSDHVVAAGRPEFPWQDRCKGSAALAALAVDMEKKIPADLRPQVLSSGLVACERPRGPRQNQRCLVDLCTSCRTGR